MYQVVKWPKHYDPLPPGYEVIQLDSGHYLWTHEESDLEGLISWDKYWVRRCAFAHADGLI